MGSDLYTAEITRIDGASLHLDLAITHPDESFFGTTKVFARRVLTDVSAPSDAAAKKIRMDVYSDDAAAVRLADEIIRDVSWSSMKNVASSKDVPGNLLIKRKGRRADPQLSYVSKVSRRGRGSV